MSRVLNHTQIYIKIKSVIQWAAFIKSSSSPIDKDDCIRICYFLIGI